MIYNGLNFFRPTLNSLIEMSGILDIFLALDKSTAIFASIDIFFFEFDFKLPENFIINLEDNSHILIDDQIDYVETFDFAVYHQSILFVVLQNLLVVCLGMLLQNS